MLVLELFFARFCLSWDVDHARGDKQRCHVLLVCMLLTKFLFELKESFFEVTVFFRWSTVNSKQRPIKYPGLFADLVSHLFNVQFPLNLSIHKRDQKMNEVLVFLTISVIAFCQMFNNPPNSVPKLNINHLS